MWEHFVPYGHAKQNVCVVQHITFSYIDQQMSRLWELRMDQKLTN